MSGCLTEKASSPIYGCRMSPKPSPNRSDTSRRRVALLSAAAAGMLTLAACGGGSTASPSDSAAASDAPSSASPTATPSPAFDGWSNPADSGKPWGDKVKGLLTFRGNPTRSYYGAGMPKNPTVQWTYPESGGLCGTSIDEAGAQTWCGSGWTGQPAVWEDPKDGKTWVSFGAYDYGIHFLDGQNGNELLPTFKTGDIIKGSVTRDPDGYPLLYSGSRDNYYRVLATDRKKPTELWKLGANDVSPVMWNDDWDGSGLVIDDYLFEGGENSQIHIVKLNRGYDSEGKVTVDPEIVWHAPGWDDELLSYITNGQVSIENSVNITGNTLYFANSGGLVQGWDISKLKSGKDPKRVFRFWTGDDTDASIVSDSEGYLYVASEFERANDRSKQIGQLMKLDPNKKDDPVVWSLKDQDMAGAGKAGIWSTPALANGVVYTSTNGGDLIAVDQETGAEIWRKDLGSQLWQSPVVVDNVLVEGDCDGNLRGFDVTDPKAEPSEIWKVKLDGCIESTPAVWNGWLYVGARGGKFYAIGDGAGSAPQATTSESAAPQAEQSPVPTN